jgi:hypothetical protein
MSSSERNLENPAATRRQSPRLHVDGRLRIAFAERAIPAVLRDISLGGFSIETLAPVRPGERCLFEIGPAEGPMSQVFARASYCRPKDDRGRSYVSGWAAETDAASERGLDAAVGYLTDGLTFE